jgi:uncharacterized membrane protein YfcA
MTTLSAAEVVGTDLCFGLVIALVGSGFEFSVGNYDAHLLILLVTGGIAGSIVGTLLTGRIAQRPLRIGLLILLVILGGQLCYRGLDLKLLNSATASSKALTLHAETARPRPPLGSPATSASLQ